MRRVSAGLITLVPFSGQFYSNSVTAFAKVEMNPHANGITAIAQISTIKPRDVVTAVSEPAAVRSVVFMAQAVSCRIESSASDASL